MTDFQIRNALQDLALYGVVYVDTENYALVVKAKAPVKVTITMIRKDRWKVEEYEKTI